MLLRELVHAYLAADGQIAVDATARVVDGVDLGVGGSSVVDPGDLRPGDVMLRFVDDPRATADYWAGDLPLGTCAIAIVADGLRSIPLSRVLAAAARSRVAVVDALQLSDLPEGTMGVVALRTDEPVAPSPWLTGGPETRPAEPAAGIIHAIGAHVLSRAIDVGRFDHRFHELLRAQRDRDRLHEALEEAERTIADLRSPDTVERQRFLEVAGAHWHLKRRIDAIYRSHTWRVGRVFWAMAHPVQFVGAVRARHASRSATG